MSKPSLAEELDNMGAEPRRNRVVSALLRLEPEDRKAWLYALDARELKQRPLAELLSKHSGLEVGARQVSNFLNSPAFINMLNDDIGE